MVKGKKMQTLLVEGSNSKKKICNYYDSKSTPEGSEGKKEEEDYSLEDFDAKEDVVSIYTDSDYSGEEEFITVNKVNDNRQKSVSVTTRSEKAEGLSNLIPIIMTLILTSLSKSILIHLLYHIK